MNLKECHFSCNFDRFYYFCQLHLNFLIRQTLRLNDSVFMNFMFFYLSYSSKQSSGKNVSFEKDTSDLDLLRFSVFMHNYFPLQIIWTCILKLESRNISSITMTFLNFPCILVNFSIYVFLHIVADLVTFFHIFSSIFLLIQIKKQIKKIHWLCPTL